MHKRKCKGYFLRVGLKCELSPPPNPGAARGERDSQKNKISSFLEILFGVSSLLVKESLLCAS